MHQGELNLQRVEIYERSLYMATTQVTTIPLMHNLRGFSQLLALLFGRERARSHYRLSLIFLLPVEPISEAAPPPPPPPPQETLRSIHHARTSPLVLAPIELEVFLIQQRGISHYLKWPVLLLSKLYALKARLQKRLLGSIMHQEGIEPRRVDKQRGPATLWIPILISIVIKVDL